MCGGIMFVFFNQKTAYELRISDWSSDVCSSDLRRHGGRHRGAKSGRPHPVSGRAGASTTGRARNDTLVVGGAAIGQHTASRDAARPYREAPGNHFGDATGGGKRERAPCTLFARIPPPEDICGRRSEEHTSELQSLLLISSAVFCLKKKRSCKHT